MLKYFSYEHFYVIYCKVIQPLPNASEQHVFPPLLPVIFGSDWRAARSEADLSQYLSWE